MKLLGFSYVMEQTGNMNLDFNNRKELYVALRSSQSVMSDVFYPHRINVEDLFDSSEIN